ncbi:MAG: SDR family NAD(P)-dependent oxidoreductase [Solirubrobacteraceae bacterium]|jgi:NAD(P)-dependent dehydrogenase (short-subunit alcohol dehydrogenase family)|nr:SDR family NAD(P)-dependent oxidoreductase [Solirubrobacteraceae bacterium]
MSLPASPTCVITGAGGGFGRALALELARRQARLLLSDVNLEAVQETARLATGAGAPAAAARRCDVSQAAEVEALCAAGDGRVDLVVNNAGVSTGGFIGELSLEDWRWTLDVDLWGVIHGCHFFTPRLRAQGSGHILNVASAAGFVAAPRMAAYNVAKAGVVSLSETLAAELEGTGVHVTALCPTFFKTDVVRSGRFTDERTRHLAEKMMAKGIPVEEVVRAALRAVERDELYCVPMADGRWLWRLKRLSPDLYRYLMSRTVKRW